MERPWIKTCVKVQFTPSFLTQAVQPRRTALKREFVFWWSKLMQTFFHPVKKLGLFPTSSKAHCWPHLLCWSYQWLMLGCWFQELLRQCGFNSQQIASQMFQTLRHWSDALLFSNAPHNITLEPLGYFWRVVPVSRVFWVDLRILLLRKYNLQNDKIVCIIGYTETNCSILSQEQLSRQVPNNTNKTQTSEQDWGSSAR